MLKEYPPQNKLKLAYVYKNGSLLEKRTNKLAVLQLRKTPTRGKRYLMVKFGNQQYFEHVLIWIWHYGNFEKGLEVDHIDGYERNNVIENLRLVTHKENMQNIHKRLK